MSYSLPPAATYDERSNLLTATHGATHRSGSLIWPQAISARSLHTKAEAPILHKPGPADPSSYSVAGNAPNGHDCDLDLAHHHHHHASIQQALPPQQVHGGALLGPFESGLVDNHGSLLLLRAEWEAASVFEPSSVMHALQVSAALCCAGARVLAIASRA